MFIFLIAYHKWNVIQVLNCRHCNSPLPLRELGPLFIKCRLVLNTAIGIVLQWNKVMDLRIPCFVTWSDTCAVCNRGVVLEEAMIQIFDTVGVTWSCFTFEQLFFLSFCNETLMRLTWLCFYSGIRIHR